MPRGTDPPYPAPVRLTRPLLTPLVAALVLVLAGCGGSGSARPDEEAALLLDFTPNAVHAGIYLARSRGFDEAEGVRLDVRPPSDSTDAVKLLGANRVDFAILDLHDVAIANAKGAELVAVYPIVQRPLASIVAGPGVTRPRDLEGKTVGVTGLPSDVAVLRSIVEGDGGDPDRVETTTIGFTAVQAVAGGRVDAATAFWNAEGRALQARRPDTRIFKLDEFGAPPYPELVLCVSRRTFLERRGVVRAAVAALRCGYEEAIVDPESAVTAMTESDPALDRDTLQGDLEALSPVFTSGPGLGRFDRERLEAWAAWEAEVGITPRPPDVGVEFDVR